MTTRLKSSADKIATRLQEIRTKGGLRREMTVAAVDMEARTVELSFSSELEYERWFGFEVLDHSAGAPNLDRLNDGGAILWNHNWDDQRGVVEPGSARVDADRVGRLLARFAKTADGEEMLQKIADKIVTKVSVGYMVHGMRLQEQRGDTDVYLVTDWEPLEVSLVSVPADPTVGVGRSVEKTKEEQTGEGGETGAIESGLSKPSEDFRKMKTKVLRDASGNLVRAKVDENDVIVEVVEVLEEAGADVQAAGRNAAATERKRSADIVEIGEKYGCAELAAKAVASGRSVAEFTADVLEHINKRGAKAPAGSAARVTERNSKPISEMEDPNIGLSEREVRSYSMFRAIRAQLPNASQRDRDAAAFEIECSETAQLQLGREAKGILIPQDVLNSRAFNAGGAANSPTGAQTGSNLVDTQLMVGSFIEMLRNRTTIMRLGTTMGGLVGNVDIPRQTGGATAYWLGEGDDATEGTPTLGQLELSPKSLAAYTDLTRRLMMQSTPDAEGIVRRDLVNAIGQAIDYAGYYGSGTANQPRGLKNYTGINAKDFAATQPTFAELVDMETLISADNADIGQMGYVGNSAFRGHAKTTAKFGSGTESTIWEPGGSVNGYRTEITNQLTTGDIFFGNFADLIIGLWGGLDLTVDPYSLSKSGGTRIVVFQDVDFVLRRVESICWGSASVS